MVSKGTVHIVASSSSGRAEIARAVLALGYHAEIYTDHDELYATAPPRGVILAEDDVDHGGICALIKGMGENSFWRPVIATSSAVNVSRVVAAVKSGAFDYLCPAVEPEQLREAIDRAMSDSDAIGAAQREAIEARARLAHLSSREVEVLDLLAAGSSNKEIARVLAISHRTVEIHRANVMMKLGANHSAEAIRCRLVASLSVFRFNPRGDKKASG